MSEKELSFGLHLTFAFKKKSFSAVLLNNCDYFDLNRVALFPKNFFTHRVYGGRKLMLLKLHADANALCEHDLRNGESTHL